METKVKNILQEMLNLTALPFDEINIEKDETLTRFNIVTSDPRAFIGIDSKVLKSIEHLLKLILSSKEVLDYEFCLDVNDFRKKQEESVKKMALAAIEKARESHVSCDLPPMSPYFRRVVHLYIANGDFKDVSTESAGEEFERRVVIKPKI